jgi:DnaJ-class molecular chaperone
LEKGNKPTGGVGKLYSFAAKTYDYKTQKPTGIAPLGGDGVLVLLKPEDQSMTTTDKFTQLVKDMRAAQRRAVHGGNSGDLQTARDLAAQVDEAVAVLSSLPDLFGKGQPCQPCQGRGIVGWEKLPECPFCHGRGNT